LGADPFEVEGDMPQGDVMFIAILHMRGFILFSRLGVVGSLPGCRGIRGRGGSHANFHVPERPP
jgi:hypothetical protein